VGGAPRRPIRRAGGAAGVRGLARERSPTPAGLRAGAGGLERARPAERAAGRPAQGRAAPPRGGGRKAAWVLALLVPAALAGAYGSGLREAWLADERTGIGETRSFSLPDGTAVDLGAASALAVDYDGETRRVRLLSGEALFTVVPRQGLERRPFVVAAEGGTVTALGTRFAVEDFGDSVRVTAVESRVEVASATPAGAGGPDRRELTAGDALTYGEGRGLGPTTWAGAADATAFTRGLLVFDGLPLRDVVARLNRYRRGRIVVANGAIAGRRVSGVFRVGDLDGAVEAVAEELGVRRIALPLVTVLY